MCSGTGYLEETHFGSRGIAAFDHSDARCRGAKISVCRDCGGDGRVLPVVAAAIRRARTEENRELAKILGKGL